MNTGIAQNLSFEFREFSRVAAIADAETAHPAMQAAQGVPPPGRPIIASASGPPIDNGTSLSACT